MRATRWVIATLVLTLPLSVPAATHAQQGQVGGQVVGLPQAPPRDRAPSPTGTAMIAGTLTAADTGLPIRGGTVTLMRQGPPGDRRSVLADSNGAFAFRDLAAGTYALAADPGMHSARYVGTGFGGSMGNSSKPIVLEDGQRVEDARIVLPRAGAIEGRIVDEFGEPVARMQVYPVRVTAGGTSFSRAGGGMLTDDLGRFRIYGLPAAEYIVAADSRGMGSMGMPVTEGETESFAATYYPSALAERDARRLRITPGAEVTGLQIQLVRTRSFRITGTVVDSQGQPVLRPNIMLMRSSSGGSMTSGSQMEPNGRFSFRNVVPGDYRIVVRPGGAPPVPGAAPAASREYATVPLHVAGDVDDLLIVTSPPVSVSGRVVFAEGPPPKVPSLRLVAAPADRMVPWAPPAGGTVDADLRFTIDEVMGPALIRPQQMPQGYALESVRLGGKDITDEPFEFRASRGGEVEVVLTSRVGRLEGPVIGEDGEPAPNATVVVLPDDKAQWKPGASRMRTSFARNGRFTASALLPGRYFVIALPPEDFSPGLGASPEYFEALAKEAIVVYVAEGETRTVDLSLFRRR
jgi:hypothetical protein